MKVQSAENVADVLTKRVSRDTWEKLCERLKLRATECKNWWLWLYHNQ